jgi:O-antigen/teichoic acid export membrane protein
MSFILIAVNSIAAPKFAALYKQGDMRTLGAVARKSAALMTLMVSPLLLICVLVPSWVMGLFGKDFESGALLLSILAIGQFVNVATGSVGYLLIMSGNEKLIRNSTALAAGVNIVLNILLVPWLGPLGAAISSATGIALYNLFNMVLVRYRLKIWVLFFGEKKTKLS